MEYKITVLDEADREVMVKEQYKLDSMGKDEWEVMEECNEINDKLNKIDEWRRYKAKCGCGYKNRKR